MGYCSQIESLNGENNFTSTIRNLLSPHLTIEYESDEEQYSSTETLNESELQDLIESEAIALTEDAIFLAKREIYRELFNISDLSISQIAQSLVDETISEVLKDLYYPDVHRGGQDSTDDGEQEPSLVPFDYDVRAHDPQRLDSIQEESETSDNSINVRIIFLSTFVVNFFGLGLKN